MGTWDMAPAAEMEDRLLSKKIKKGMDKAAMPMILLFSHVWDYHCI